MNSQLYYKTSMTVVISYVIFFQKQFKWLMVGLELRLCLCCVQCSSRRSFQFYLISAQTASASASFSALSCSIQGEDSMFLFYINKYLEIPEPVLDCG